MPSSEGAESIARAAPTGAAGRAAPEPRPARFRFRALSAVQRAGLVLGPLVFLVVAFAPTGLREVPGFGSRPAFAAGVTLLMAIWWLTEALPIAVTACVPLVAYPLFGVFGRGPARDVVAAAEPFADAYIFLFLGGMTIGAAMEESRLHKRVAIAIMRAIGTEPKRLLLGMLVATASVSLWISNTATAVMMMPIGLALIAELEAASGRRRLLHFGAAVMLAVAYGSNIGGIGTKIGTGTNSIFCGFVSDKLRLDIGFLQYMALGLPFVVLMLPVVWLVLWRGARKDALTTGHSRAVLDRELAKLGRMARGEKTVAAVFLVAAALWIAGDPLRKAIAPFIPAPWEGFKLQGKHYEAAVAMSAAFALSAARALPWRAVRRIPYGTLLLLGGSFAMASGIEGSGLSKWMAQNLAALSVMPEAAQVALASFATVGLSAVASNTATINVALNVLPPSVPVLSASALAASCDFALPAGTPPNAIVFGSGYIRLPTMMKTGIGLDLLAAALISLYASLYASRLF